MKFDWDPKKAKLNLAKHGVAFDRAQLVFFDEFAIEEPDPEPTEVRHRRTGMANGVLLRVVYTEREVADRLVIWLISARPLTKTERKRYEEEES